jgi:precorrin-2 methylase
VVGIGAGNPEHITVQAISTLNAVDAVFLMDKGDITTGRQLAQGWPGHAGDVVGDAG